MDNYAVEYKTKIPYEFRSSGPNSCMPPLPKNGGIYGGKELLKPWMPIPIVPTTTNYMKNLDSANPPPGAQDQFIGTNRAGNNYTSMPTISWYNSSHESKGPYNLKVTNN